MAEIPIPEGLSQTIMQRPVQKEAIRPYMPAPPSKARPMGEFFGALSQQGQQWYSTLKEREAFEQFNRAQVDTLTDESAYGQWQRKNSATPDIDLVQYDNSMEASRQKIRGYLTNGVALRRWEAWEKLRDVPRREAALGNMVKISDEARLARIEEGLRESARTTDKEGNPIDDWNIPAQIITTKEFQEESGLSFKQLDSMLEDVKSFAAIQTNEEQVVLNEQREKDRDTIGKAIDDPTKSYIEIDAMIQASSLIEKEQTQFQKRAKDTIEARAVPYADVTDDATFIKANETMDDYQKGMVDKDNAQKELFASKSKLTKADYESVRSKFIEAQDPNSPLKRPSVKRAFTLLEEYKDIRIGIMKRDGASEAELRNELLLWNGIKNDLEHWTLQEDRTDKEIEAQVEYLTASQREEMTLTLFENLMAGFFRAGKGKFERALAEKKIDTLKEEGKWKRLDSTQQAKAREMFVEGKTIKEFLTWERTGEDVVLGESQPTTQKEFENTVSAIEDEDEASAYYLKWKHKWQ